VYEEYKPMAILWQKVAQENLRAELREEILVWLAEKDSEGYKALQAEEARLRAMQDIAGPED